MKTTHLGELVGDSLSQIWKTTTISRIVLDDQEFDWVDVVQLVAQWSITLFYFVLFDTVFVPLMDSMELSPLKLLHGVNLWIWSTLYRMALANTML